MGIFAKNVSECHVHELSHITAMVIVLNWSFFSVGVWDGIESVDDMKKSCHMAELVGPFFPAAVIWGEGSPMHFPPALFFFFFLNNVEISSRTLIPLFTPRLIHSGSTS